MITPQNNLASMVAQYRASQPQQAAPQPMQQPAVQQPMPQTDRRALLLRGLSQGDGLASLFLRGFHPQVNGIEPNRDAGAIMGRFF